jgi:hypothetical protein
VRGRWNKLVKQSGKEHPGPKVNARVEKGTAVKFGMEHEESMGRNRIIEMGWRQNLEFNSEGI